MCWKRERKKERQRERERENPAEDKCKISWSCYELPVALNINANWISRYIISDCEMNTEKWWRVFFLTCKPLAIWQLNSIVVGMWCWNGWFSRNCLFRVGCYEYWFVDSVDFEWGLRISRGAQLVDSAGNEPSKCFQRLQTGLDYLKEKKIISTRKLIQFKSWPIDTEMNFKRAFSKPVWLRAREKRERGREKEFEQLQQQQKRDRI